MSNGGTTPDNVGCPIPRDDEHTWRSNIGYEEGEEWVLSRMKAGYPRFFIHPLIKQLHDHIITNYGADNHTENCIAFPSHKTALLCLEFMKSSSGARSYSEEPRALGLDFVGSASPNEADPIRPVTVHAVLYPEGLQPVAKAFWQHSGEGISSRRAQYLLRHLSRQSNPQEPVSVVPSSTPDTHTPGPRRYMKASAASREKISSKLPAAADDSGTARAEDPKDMFIDERYGRYLNQNTAETAKNALRRRIAGLLGEHASAPADSERKLEATDVFLFPSGMSAIFNSHRLLLSAFGSRKSVCFGFPYIDTLKILEKFGPGCYFLGNGDASDLAELERVLSDGNKILAVFCEFPSNPLLKSPDIVRIRQLADQYSFALVIDETIGNFLNLNLLPYADILVSSLTKLFSGDGNVMGGSLVLNPKGKHAQKLRQQLSSYEDNYWIEDAIVLERNSRDFVSRNRRINENASLLCELFLRHGGRVKDIFYPQLHAFRPQYDRHKVANGGYGGLLSVVFYSQDQAIEFYDALQAAKGPSLGTNFSLASPYTLLAHYNELDWARKYGVESHLIRISVGLEDSAILLEMFTQALNAIKS